MKTLLRLGRHPIWTLRLALRFAWAVVTSGLDTLRIIARAHQSGPEPGFVRLEHAPLSPTGAVILGSLITLTPGTTLVAVELAQSTLVVHLLDRRGVADLVAASRRFEAPLVVLFGEKSK